MYSGDLVVVGLGDLDVVAKDFIEAHLQGLDPRLLLLGGLQLGDGPLGVGEQFPQLVHVRVVAGADEAALPDGEGGSSTMPRAMGR